MGSLACRRCGAEPSWNKRGRHAIRAHSCVERAAGGHSESRLAFEELADRRLHERRIFGDAVRTARDVAELGLEHAQLAVF